LSTEVARSSPQTKQVFERMMVAMKDELSKHVSGHSAAWVMISQMVGAVMIARAMASEQSRNDLLEVVMQQCQEMIR